ncbi:MAG: YihY/virulence factor BrkB family protein, partial [Anaerolineae bacterium]
IVAVTVAGLVLGREAVQGRVLEEVSAIAGADVAGLVSSVLTNANTLSRSSGVLATTVAVVTLLLGASGIFGLLREVLDRMWDVALRPAGGGLAGTVRTIKRRLFAVALVLGSGFLLLLTVLAGAVLSAVVHYFGDRLGSGAWLWQTLNFLLSFVVTMAVFAAILKLVPDVELGWRDVGVGAAFTALLFSIGRFAIGLYLGRSTVASAYGAAGAVVALLIWIYYSAQILLLGAEFTHVYVQRRGASIRPADGAMLIDNAG